MTLAAAFERLERDAREKKELLRPVDVADLLTAIDFYIRAGHRRGKARTTLRTEYYDLMYFYDRSPPSPLMIFCFTYIDCEQRLRK